MKLTKIDEVCNSVMIHFLSDDFALFSARNFATVATWRNEFSSLLGNVLI